MIPSLSDGAVIGFEDLTVRYGKKTVLENISFRVPAGSVYALLGRNGVGKSSAVRCLLGQQKPTNGRITLFGQDVWKHRARLMEKVGVIPEEPDAPSDMNAKQIVQFCSSLYPSWDPNSVNERLARFKVPMNVAFGSLSKGQKGQVALALALGSSPDLLVLDDPTLGLDVVARKNFFEELVGELADRGMTVIITSHDLTGIERIADRIGIVKDNKLVVDEEIETLKAKFRRIRYPNKGIESAYGNALDTLDTVQVKVSGWGVEAVVSNYDELSFNKFRNIGGIMDAEVSAMSLEDIFTAIVGEKGE